MPYVRRWPAAAAALAVLALVLGFVATDTALLQPYGLAIDVAIADELRSSVLTPVMLGISFLASPPVAVVTVLACTGLLVAGCRRPVAAVETALVVAAGWGAALVVKVLVGRPRPPLDLVHSLAPETGMTSYPSGHVAYAVSAAIAAWFLVRGTQRARPVAAAGAIAVVLVAASRLYLGVHYLGDVIGSVLVAGAAIVLLTGLWHGYLRNALLSATALAPLLARFSTSDAGRADLAGRARW